MRRTILLSLIVLISSTMYSQSGQKWSVGGNTVSSGDYLGTNNNQALSLRTNGTEWLKITPGGNYVFSSLSGTGFGLITANANGRFNRIDFSGNSGEVLLGDGTFGSVSTLTGWSLNSGSLFTPYTVSVNTQQSLPGYALTVNGNVFANGKITATSMEVAELVYADTVKGGKTFKIRESLCFEGYSATDPNSRNEICGMNNDLYIMSENVPYNTILNFGNNGNVGIGTDSPQYKLDVNGNFHVGGKTYLDRVFVSRISSNDSIIAFGDSTIYMNVASNYLYPSTNGSFKGIGYGNLALARALNSVAIGHRVGTLTNANEAITIGSGSATNVLYNNIPQSLMIGFNSNLPTLFVSSSSGNNTSGNVGVGTTNPLDKLQVGEGIQKAVIGSMYFPNLNYGTSYLGFNAARNSNGYWVTTGDNTNNGGSIIYGDHLGRTFFASIATTGVANSDQSVVDGYILNHVNMVIKEDGKVGVGTDCIPPEQRFAVAGGIICEEVTVDVRDNSGCWPDYVFSDSYQMMTLSEVEAYINANKKLPGMPSAQDIEANGIKTSEILTKHTEKIEEITLYLIELSKKIEQLEQENAILKKQLEEK